MRTALLLFLALLLPRPSWARAHGEIVQMTRPLRMSESEPTPPMDYYLDLGAADGLKEGDIVQVFRSYPVVTSAGLPGQLVRVALGRLKLIVVSPYTSIARVHESREPSSLPAMDSKSFLLGDEVEFAATKTDLPSH